MKAKEYIKYFNDHSEYVEFTGTTEFVKPNVSLCVAEGELHYNRKVAEESTDPDFNLEYTLVDGTSAVVYNAIQHRDRITSFKVDGSDADTKSNIGYRFGDYDFGTTGKHTAKMEISEGLFIGFFDSCDRLTKAVVPSGTTDATSMFNMCTNLTYIELPSTITVAEACTNASSLQTLKIWATVPPRILEGEFDNAPEGFEILVPKNSVNAYKEATNWSAYADKIKPIK